MLVATAVTTGLLTPIITYSDQSKAVQRLTPFEVLSDTSSISQIKQAISEVAIKYGLNEAGFARLILCESSFNHNQYGDHGLAYGLLQFHEATFERYCDGDYHNIKDQLVCGAKMIKNGEGSNWSCIYKYLSN